MTTPASKLSAASTTGSSCISANLLLHDVVDPLATLAEVVVASSSVIYSPLRNSASKKVALTRQSPRQLAKKAKEKADAAIQAVLDMPSSSDNDDDDDGQPIVCWVTATKKELRKLDPKKLKQREEAIERLILIQRAKDWSVVEIALNPDSPSKEIGPRVLPQPKWKLSKLLGIPYKYGSPENRLFNVKQLRQIASKLGFTNLWKARLNVIVQAIVDGKSGETKHNTARDCELQQSASKAPENSKTTKGQGCVFRLINVLLSDLFREKLSTLFRPQNRDLIESGLTLAKDEHFWTLIQEAFVDSKHDQNDEVFSKIHSQQVELTADSSIKPGMNMRLSF